MEKQFIFWRTGRGCLVGLLLPPVAFAVMFAGLALGLGVLPRLLFTFAAVAPLALLASRVDRSDRGQVLAPPEEK